MTMRLSEAIRLGAMLRPQTFNERLTKRGSCAWGAALETVGCVEVGTPWPAVAPVALAWWPWAFRVDSSTLVASPCACGGELSATWAAGIIVHLNNKHRWTREAIADWVETIEPRTSPLTESVPSGTVTNVTEPTHSPQEATR